MNSNVMPSIVNIEKDKLRKLVEEVKETLATDVKTDTAGTNQKSFGIVDLWNRHKSLRTAFSLRRY
jgi:translation elongation factor EF-1beta